MNFQGLVHIEDADTYIDTAFKQANKAAERARQTKFRDHLQKSKTVEFAKVKAMNASLQKPLRKIIESYPSMDQLPEFYAKLVRLQLEYKLVKKSLGAINWAVKQLDKLFQTYQNKILKCRELKKINAYRREYTGRASSVLKQIRKELDYLEHARRTMKRFPNIKTSLPTICLFGFPNVGKTTLLSKMTTADPEINSYAFTTKDLNTGYFSEGIKKFQVVDTPGTLNRLDKMNDIEQQAHYVAELCADLIVYVFDLTESYPMKDQKKLFERAKKFGKPMLIYLSKTDILDKDVVDSFLNAERKIPVCTSEEEVKKQSLDMLKDVVKEMPTSS